VVGQHRPNITEHPEIEDLPDDVELEQQQRHTASMQNPPAWRAASAIRRAADALKPSGFSTKVGFPASKLNRAIGKCAGCVVAT
jgi:hypothetical protein